jgi:hypothetical protein
MIKSRAVVETIGKLSCSAKDAWETVCFYEHIRTKPSWMLRTVLPVPLKTTGCYGKIGDSSRCMYSDGGYLAKKITNIVPGERIDFDIIEQSIRYCRSIALRGGTIQIVAHDDASCSVRMITHYEFLSPVIATARYFVDRTISSMHRIVICDMDNRLCGESTAQNPARCTEPRAHTQHPLPLGPVLE